MYDLLNAEFGADLYSYRPSFRGRGTVKDLVTGCLYVVWVEDGALVVNPIN